MAILTILKSLLIFLLAGLCEIGGGYLIWLWLKEGKPLWYGIAGAFILALYGVVATWQASDFARVYATYGGFLLYCRCCGLIKWTIISPTDTTLSEPLLL